MAARDYKSPRDLVAVPILCRATQQGNAESCENLAPTLTAAAGMSGNNQPIVTIPIALASGSRNAEMNFDDISPCLLARAGTGGGNVPMITIPYTLKIRAGCAGGVRAY